MPTQKTKKPVTPAPVAKKPAKTPAKTSAARAPAPTAKSVKPAPAAKPEPKARPVPASKTPAKTGAKRGRKPKNAAASNRLTIWTCPISKPTWSVNRCPRRPKRSSRCA
jgi:RNA polymerase primary sigma factor